MVRLRHVTDPWPADGWIEISLPPASRDFLSSFGCAASAGDTLSATVGDTPNATLDGTFVSSQVSHVGGAPVC